MKVLGNLFLGLLVKGPIVMAIGIILDLTSLFVCSFIAPQWSKENLMHLSMTQNVIRFFAWHMLGWAVVWFVCRHDREVRVTSYNSLVMEVTPMGSKSMVRIY